MARTTVDIDAPILKELKSLQKKEKRSLGQIMSQLLAEALSRRTKAHKPAKLQWVTRAMNATIDLTDKETVYSVLDQGKK
jgi:hypothetical protein